METKEFLDVPGLVHLVSVVANNKRETLISNKVKGKG